MRIKYPRTFHLPNSPGATNDDKILKHMDHFAGKDIVVTEKMDGENTTVYTDGFHARSIDSKNHPSRDWLKRFHAEFGYNIPDTLRICGENLYAKHSIHYQNLASYFEVFSIWEEYTCLSFIDTLHWCNLLGLDHVPVLFSGKFEDFDQRNLDLTDKEGFVIRLAESFNFSDFSKSVAKWVRPNHVQTDDHWMQQELILNVMKKS